MFQLSLDLLHSINTAILTLPVQISGFYHYLRNGGIKFNMKIKFKT